MVRTAPRASEGVGRVNPILKQAWQLAPGYVIRMRSTGQEVTVRKVEQFAAGEKRCVSLRSAFVSLMLLDQPFFIVADPHAEYRVLKRVKLPPGANRVTGCWPAVRERAA